MTKKTSNFLVALQENEAKLFFTFAHLHASDANKNSM